MQQQNDKQDREFSLAYIDIERLITANLAQRVSDVVTGDLPVRTIEDFCMSGEVAAADDDTSETESMAQADVRIESVRNLLCEFSNVVTGTWVFRLIDDEMRRQSACSLRRIIFLVVLVPNRVNLFKRSLFLNQAPNRYQIPFDFIALHLTSGACQSKDLDLTSASAFSSETSMMFVRYFRSINKLLEVNGQREKAPSKRLRLRATCSQQDSTSKRIKTQADLTRVLASHDFAHTLHVNLINVPSVESRETFLIFMLDNRIEVDGWVQLELDGSVTDMSKVKHLIEWLRSSAKAAAVGDHRTGQSRRAASLSATCSVEKEQEEGRVADGVKR